MLADFQPPAGRSTKLEPCEGPEVKEAGMGVVVHFAPREAQCDSARTMSVAVRLDLRARLGPVGDQGAPSTCLAHGTATAHEHTRGSTLIN